MPERTPTTTKSPSRRRLPRSEARARILAAAERKLAEVGPEGLRLTELAAELGISHPAILHHFGKREDLIAAVVTRAHARFNQRLLEAIEATRDGSEAILDMIAEFYGSNGNARLIAWLVLSGRTPKPRARRDSARPLERMIERVHEQRVRAYPNRAIERDDSRFQSQLTAFALLGEALFGDMIRHASGDDVGPASSRDFRRRLARLLAGQR